jgi:mRNA interferase MazF
VRHGEIWWADVPGPMGRRPVVLLSRDEAYSARELVTVAPVTTRIRRIPVEVPLGRENGLRRTSAVNLDSIVTIPKRALQSRIARLDRDKLTAVHNAIRFALALDD